MDAFAVVMAGGSGTRFWPASRRRLPKQYLSIGDARPLVAQTFARLEGLVPLERILVVSSRDQAKALSHAIPKLPPENLLLEPCGRNTAAAVAWAALEIRRRDPNSLQVVLPADHVIRPLAQLQASLRAGLEEARESASLVTFGIRPTRPATGFGYIELGASLPPRAGEAVFAVQRFVEKPDAARAQQFLDSGRFLWNAGIFAWRTDTIVAALERDFPQAVQALSSLPQGDALDQAYQGLPSISIDVAVMERESRVHTLPIEYFWSDVGTWNALADVLAPDVNDNRVSGGTALESQAARGNIVYGEAGQLVALIGVDDLVVVRAGEVVLVTRRDRVEEVRGLVERLTAARSPHV